MPEATEKWQWINHTPSQSLNHSSLDDPSPCFPCYIQEKKKKKQKERRKEAWRTGEETQKTWNCEQWLKETTSIWLFPGRICSLITQARIKVIGMDWTCQFGLKIVCLLLSREGHERAELIKMSMLLIFQINWSHSSVIVYNSGT